MPRLEQWVEAFPPLNLWNYPNKMISEVDIRDMSSNANKIQYGGDHYKKYGDLQPWDVITKWQLGYLEGTALKYIARWKDKNGIEDLNKAIHFLQKAVEVYGVKK